VNTLTDDQVQRLKAVLAPDAAVVLWGCGTAGTAKKEMDAQRLADTLGCTVWGTNHHAYPAYEADCSRPWFVPGFLNDWVHRSHGEDPVWDRFVPNPPRRPEPGGWDHLWDPPWPVTPG